MIYPLLYKYNAPYRGPRNIKEINKVLTSISYNINAVMKQENEHKAHIDNNMEYNYHCTGKCISSLETAGELYKIEQNYGLNEYKSIHSLQSSLNSIETKLDNMLKNF